MYAYDIMQIMVNKSSSSMNLSSYIFKVGSIFDIYGLLCPISISSFSYSKAPFHCLSVCLSLFLFLYFSLSPLLSFPFEDVISFRASTAMWMIVMLGSHVPLGCHKGAQSSYVCISCTQRHNRHIHMYTLANSAAYSIPRYFSFSLQRINVCFPVVWKDEICAGGIPKYIHTNLCRVHPNLVEKQEKSTKLI